MWDRVKARKHKIHRVFAAAPGSPEIMLYGEVKQTLRSGGDLVKEWAAHGVPEKSAEDGKWRWAFYQVYLACSFFPSQAGADSGGELDATETDCLLTGCL